MRRPLKIFVVGATGLLVLGAIAGVLLIRTLRYGFSAHDEPTAIEAIAARALRRWAVPSDLRQVENPLPFAPAVLANGRAHWADHCASCHGNDGKGQTAIGQHVYPKAPDMTLAPTQTLSDGDLFATIENGIRLTAMPGWGNGTAESAHGSWQLVHFIRHLPQLSAAEIAEMEALNPKSPEEWAQMKTEADFLAGDDTPPAAPKANPPHHH